MHAIMKKIKNVVLLALLVVVNNVLGQPTKQQNTATESSPDTTPVKEIIVVFKTHFDIGYTHRVNEIVHYYRTEMIDRSLNAMDSLKHLPAEQQFKWTCPGWVMSKVMEP